MTWNENKQVPTPAAATPNIPSAKPGTVDAKAKKVEKVHCSWFDENDEKTDEDGRITELESLKEMAEKFDKKLHKPIKRTDFSEESLWWEWRAIVFDGQAAEARMKAKEAATLGSKSERAKAKRFVRMSEKLEALKAELAASGTDMAALMATLADDAEANPKTDAEPVAEEG